jgi:hypothetical protein
MKRVIIYSDVESAGKETVVIYFKTLRGIFNNFKKITIDKII